MNDDKRTLDASNEAVDERSIARKYGLKELVYPDSEQTKTLSQFLGNAIETGKCGPVPKMAVMVMLEFLQAVLNRQHITKGPRMSHDEFDLLQTPYYLAARIISKTVRERKDIAEARGKMYQTAYTNLNQFMLDPGCYWLRRNIPEGVIEAMTILREFALAYPELRRKGRAL